MRASSHASLAVCALLIIGMMVLWKTIAPSIQRIINDRQYAALWVAK